MNKITLAPLRRPITDDQWKRLPDNLNRAGRDSDQNCVDLQIFVSFGCKITPTDDRILGQEARRRGISKAAVVRGLIRQMAVPK